jgi:hypothetical protein
MPELDFLFPLGGRDDAYSPDKQPIATTREATNMRPFDPTSGRIRGAVRPGTAKACAQQLAAAPARALVQTVYDSAFLTYASGLGAPRLEWDEDGDKVGDCEDVAYDEFGNSYWLDGGRAVQVRSSSGVLLDTIALPLERKSQYCRAMSVGSGGDLYVGVTQGGTKGQARVWCFRRDPYLGWQKRWELAPGAFVARIVEREGVLLLATNELDPYGVPVLFGDYSGRAWIESYTLEIAPVAPALAWRRAAMAPVNGLAVHSDGRIAACTRAQANRGKPSNALGVQLEPDFASWRISDLSGWADRGWCIFNASDIDLDDNAPVLRWQDAAGLGRELYAPLENVVLENMHCTLGGTNPADGETITFTSGDGRSTETLRFKNALAQSGDVLIGANLAATLQSLERAIKGSAAGTGVDFHAGTEPSALVTCEYQGSSNHIKIYAQVEVPAALLTLSGTNLDLNGGGGRVSDTSGRVVPGKRDGGFGQGWDGIVVSTAPTLRKNGSAGRPCVYFDGLSNKLVTDANGDSRRANKENHRALIPSYGINQTQANSAGFVLCMVVRPLVQYATAPLIAQKGNIWHRSIAINREARTAGTTAGYASGKLCFSEYVNATGARFYSETVYDPTVDTDTPLLLVTLRSDPDGGAGKTEMRVNGKVVATINGEANDGTGRTEIGHATIPKAGTGERAADRFANFELYALAVISDDGSSLATRDEMLRMEAALAWEFGLQGSLYVTASGVACTSNGTNDAIEDVAHGRSVDDCVRFAGTPCAELNTRQVYWIVATPSADEFQVSESQGGSAIDLSTQGTPFSYSVVHAYSQEPPPGNGDPLGTNHFAVQSLSEKPAVTKYLADGTPSWIVTSDETQAAMAGYVSGVGSGVAWASDDKLYNTGQLADPSAPDQTTVRAIVDLGDEGSIDPSDGAWTYELSTPDNPSWAVRLAVDENDGVYVPFAFEGFASGVAPKWYIHCEADGTATLGGAGSPVYSSRINGRAIALDPIAPDFAQNLTAIDHVHRLSIALSRYSGVGDPATTMAQLSLVTSTPTGGGKVSRTLAASGGTVYRFDDSTRTAITDDDAATDPLDTAPRYVHSVALFGKAFFVDGRAAKVYDALEDSLGNYKADGKGRVPERCRIIEKYAGGIVMCAGDDPYEWFMSARPRPFDWDFAPDVQTITQAWKGGLGGPGRLPDIVNGFCPIFDDLGLFFCDHSIWRLTGDPGSPGSRFDPISETIGGSFGRAWAIAPDGTPFFWSSQGGLYVVNGGTGVEQVRSGALDRVFQSIDLSAFFVRMAWNVRLGGLDIMVCPYGSGSSGAESYFWHRATNSLWIDDRASSAHDPTDVLVVDSAAPDDRYSLIACRDGYVRQWSETARDDDGQPIFSNVVLGPYQLDARLEMKVSRMLVALEQAQGHASVSVFGTDTPTLPTARPTGFPIRAGLTPSIPVRVRGAYIWLEIRSSTRWAFESARAAMQTGARRRLR